MDAPDFPSIEEILREYDVDGLLDPKDFEKLLDTLRNRENIMLTEFVFEENN